MRVFLNYVNCFLIAKVLPKTIRCEYDELIVRLEFMHANRWLSAQYRSFNRFTKAKLCIQRLLIEFSPFKIYIPDRSGNLQDQNLILRKRLMCLMGHFSLENGHFQPNFIL